MYLDEVIAVLQVNDNRYIQVLVARGEGQGDPGHTVAHSCVLRQRFAQVSPGLRMLTAGEMQGERETLTHCDHTGAADTHTSNQSHLIPQSKGFSDQICSFNR